LQPTAAERKMHPEVIAAADDRVVVRWHQRGRSPAEHGFDGPVLGLYEVRQGRLARAQMFCFDTDAVTRFLVDAARARPMSHDGVGGGGQGQAHPNVRLLEAFYQAQAAFYAGGDDTAALRDLLADDIAWHVPGRSPIAGHYHGYQEVLGYFAARRAQAKATFRVLPRAILADDQRVVQLADGQMERDGKLQTWQTVGVFRIADDRIAECWLVPFDQYLFDELWS
jgi:ketosteroid isomerase-like protein